MKKLAAAAALLAAVAFASPARADDAQVDTVRVDTADLSLGPTLARMQLSMVLGAAEAVRVERPTTVFGLPKNMGPIDRGFRIALAATLVGVGAYRLSNDSPNTGLSYALMGVAVIPAATGATGYCPLYQLLGIDNTF